MLTKEELQQIKGTLGYGDIKAIAIYAFCSPTTVRRYLRGESSNMRVAEGLCKLLKYKKQLQATLSKIAKE